LLAGSIFLYPICGYMTDRLKTATVVHKLFMLSAFLTLSCYFWLALPPSFTRSPTPALVSFGCGHGFATLLLVIIVPHLVPIKYVSTALGAHKSLEQTGTTIAQTLAGLLLDKTRDISAPDTPNNLIAIQTLLNIFLVINILQLLGAIGLWRMQVSIDKRTAAGAPVDHKGYMAVPTTDAEVATDDARVLKGVPEEAVEWNEVEAAWRSESEPEESGVGKRPAFRTLSARSDRPLLAPSTSVGSKGSANGKGKAKSRSERRRGKAFALLSGLSIVSAWILFMSVAYAKLRAED